MRYYVLTDIHSFFRQMKDALEEKEYFSDTGPKKIIICGDLFDRGPQPKELIKFILKLLEKDEIILIRGNHEDLMVDLVERIEAYSPATEYTHHGRNGTYKTALTLTRMNKHDVEYFPSEFREKMKKTDFFTKILPEMKNYYETENYIFVHGWIPCNEQKYMNGYSVYSPMSNWRGANERAWEKARWYNGMAAAKCGVIEKGKTIVCGHFRTSWGHSVIEGKGRDDFGLTSDFSPYYNDGIIALDGCTAFSKIVNCIVIED